MKLIETPDLQTALSRALRQMNCALALLDELDAPGEVGTHLDLAICRLEKHLGINAPSENGAGALYAGLAEELLSSTVVDEVRCPWT